MMDSPTLRELLASVYSETFLVKPDVHFENGKYFIYDREAGKIHSINEKEVRNNIKKLFLSQDGYEIS